MIKFERAQKKDALKLKIVKEASFYEDDCPGDGNLETKLQEAIAAKGVYKILVKEEVVGLLSLREQAKGIYFIDCLGVIPSYEHQGIGQAALAFIEQNFPLAQKFIIPLTKERTQRFYEKSGFKVVETYEEGSVTFTKLEKTMPLTREGLVNWCLSYDEIYLDYPFDEEWQAFRHKQNQKTFAFLYERQGQLWLNLKCEPLKAQFLREMYEAVVPAYHMNKKHWNTILLEKDLPREVLLEMITQSYHLIQPKRRKNSPSTTKKTNAVKK